MPPNTRISQHKDSFFPSEVNQTVATTTNQEARPFILSREGLFASSDDSKWAKFHISCLFPGHLHGAKGRSNLRKGGNRGATELWDKSAGVRGRQVVRECQCWKCSLDGKSSELS